MLLAYLVCFVFFAAVAMTINEGLWNNAILLLAIVLGGLFGIFVGVPVGNMIAAQAGADMGKAWYFVFAGVWGVFSLSVLVIRLIMERTSKVRMKFIPLVDKIGGPIVGLIAAVMFTSFVTYTLDRIPIKAGEWNYSDASGWQESVFRYAKAPFDNIAYKFAQGESISTDFLRKP